MVKPENYNYDPKLPEMENPFPEYGGGCGGSFHSNYEFRRPYKHVDNYSIGLPAIWEDPKVISDDLEVSIPIMLLPEVRSAIFEAIVGGLEILEKYNNDGFMDSNNFTNIKKIFKRAEKYVNIATGLKNYWDNEYRPDAKVAYGWSLNEEDYGNGCYDDGEHSPVEGEMFTMTASGAKTISFNCPTNGDIKTHANDRMKFYQFMRAALINTRCAQEAAGAVGTYLRNKKDYDDMYGGKFKITDETPYKPSREAPARQAPPRAPVIGEELPPTVPDEEVEDDEPLVPESISKVAKKKDNTLLIAGAAALGLLLLRK